MLIGEYRYRIGLKNRVALPKKFRDDLGERVVAMRGYEGSIMVVSRKNWSKLVEEAIGGPLTDPKVRDTARFLMGRADSSCRHPWWNMPGRLPEKKLFLSAWVDGWSSGRRNAGTAALRKL